VVAAGAGLAAGGEVGAGALGAAGAQAARRPVAAPAPRAVGKSRNSRRPDFFSDMRVPLVTMRPPSYSSPKRGMTSVAILPTVSRWRASGQFITKSRTPTAENARTVDSNPATDSSAAVSSPTDQRSTDGSRPASRAARVTTSPRAGTSVGSPEVFQLLV